MKKVQVKNVVLLLARVLLSAIFLWGAFGKFSDISGMSTAMNLPEWQMWLAAFAELIGGMMILLGIYIHVGTLILLAFVVTATLMFHFPLTDNLTETAMFYKNLGLMGGLLALMAAGGGKLQVCECKCDK